MQADSKNGGCFRLAQRCRNRCFTVYSSTCIVRVTREPPVKGAQGNPLPRYAEGNHSVNLALSQKVFFRVPQTFSEKCRKSDSFSW